MFDRLNITYQSLTLPAPYAFVCTLEVYRKDELDVKLQLNYIDREELTEEDILEEGFSGDDDFKGDTKLGDSWKEVLTVAYAKTSMQRKSKQERAFSIDLEFLKGSECDKHGQPLEYGMWEYLCQELMQAVFEGCKVEQPFYLKALRIKNGQSHTFEIKASFLERTAELIQNHGSKYLNWIDFRQYMKIFFQPDFNPEEALQKSPKGNGYYIQTIPGEWYQSRKSILNPTDESDLLGRMEHLMDELIDASL